MSIHILTGTDPNSVYNDHLLVHHLMTTEMLEVHRMIVTDN